MHRCLTVIEILHEIFTDFRDNWHDSCTLAMLAQTCQMFSAPALNILWRDQISFGPLLQCMPEDLWTTIGAHENIEGTDKMCLIFRRCLRASDWDRFDFYIRKITINFDYVPLFVVIYLA